MFIVGQRQMRVAFPSVAGAVQGREQRITGEIELRQIAVRSPSVRLHFAANTDAPQNVPTGWFVFHLMNCIPLADGIVKKRHFALRGAEALAPRNLTCFSFRQSPYPIVEVNTTALSFR